MSGRGKKVAFQSQMKSNLKTMKSIKTARTLRAMSRRSKISSKSMRKTLRSLRPSTQRAAFFKSMTGLAPAGYMSKIAKGRKYQEKLDKAFDRKLKAAQKVAARQAAADAAAAIAAAAAAAAADEASRRMAEEKAEEAAAAQAAVVEAEEEEEEADADIAALSGLFSRAAEISSHTPPYHGGRRRTRRNRKA
jgi:hypothetical protein